jgi:hypothetical protein
MAITLTACAWLAGIGDLSLTGDGGVDSTTEGGDDVAVDAVSPGMDAPPPPGDSSPLETGASDGAQDSTPGEGGADAGAMDSASPDTGATDAPYDSGSMVPPSDPQDPSAPCSMQPAYILCDDFDEPGEQPFTASYADPPWGWTSITGGGDIRPFDLVHFTSSPRSAKFYLPPTPLDASVGATAQIGITGPGSSLTTSFRVALDLRIDATMLDSGPGQVALAQWATDGSGGQYYNVLVENGVVDLALPSSTRVPISGASPPLQQWVRLVVAFDVSSGVTTIFDGQTVGTSTAGMGTPPGHVRSLSVGGVFSYGPSSPLTLELDNVVLQGH